MRQFNFLKFSLNGINFHTLLIGQKQFAPCLILMVFLFSNTFLGIIYFHTYNVEDYKQL
jgi:hypothetical protein